MNNHFQLDQTTAPVSVVIPCYCSADTIERAVQSVMDQTVLPAELILVDDGSPDQGKTLEKLFSLRRRYGSAIRIAVIALKENHGPAAARNAGWDQASEEYLAFLDADDTWHQGKLAFQFGWMRGHPEVSMTGHGFAVKPSNNTVAMNGIPLKVWEVSPRRLLASNRFPTPSVMLKRNLSFRFAPGKRQAEDYLLWLQIILSGCKAWRIEYPFVFLHKAAFGEGGLSSMLWEHEKGEIDTYLRLYRGKLLTLPATALSILFSILKFVRRSVIAFLFYRWPFPSKRPATPPGL